MYHPAAALHQPDLKKDILSDFSRLYQLLNQPAEVKPARETPEPLQKNAENPPEQLSLF
jgi:hypothetical protein